MKNLLRLKDLSTEQIMSYILLASKLKSGLSLSIEDKKIATLFFEDSTRTHYSFSMAILNTKAKEININVRESSVNKGESLYDTVKTLESLGFDGVVIRSSKDKYYEELKDLDIHIFNAGDGKSDHPTQNLLDLMTIYEEYKKFEGLNVLIVGDTIHSRVAHGNIEVMKRLGMNVYVSGPKDLVDKDQEYIELDEGLKKCDVCMLLRVQFERHEQDFISKDTYNELYGLNKRRYDLMKNNAIIMHPAPVNRGLEITDELVEAKKSRIFKQMQNGVYIRMAVLLKSFRKDV